MNQDFDRQSLDHRINDIEKIKFSNNTFPSIDFDAYEDNSILRTKDGVVFKCFYDLPSFQLNVCGICSTRYGIISGQNLFMARLVVKNAHVMSGREGYSINLRYRYLGEDCSNYTLIFDIYNVAYPWSNFGLDLFNAKFVIPTISGADIDALHTFDGGYSSGIYLDLSGKATIGQGVYFFRQIGCCVNGSQQQNFPMFLFEDSVGSARYNTVADLPNKYKPLFPASWSV